MRITLVILACILLSACSSNERPEGILSEEEMIPILLDVYLGEGRLSSMNLKRDSALKVFEVLEGRVFEKYNTTDSIYRTSIVYYYDHPKEMEKIYEVVLDSLNLREQVLNEKQGDEIKEMKERNKALADDDEEEKEIEDEKEEE